MYVEGLYACVHTCFILIHSVFLIVRISSGHRSVCDMVGFSHSIHRHMSLQHGSITMSPVFCQ